MYRSVVVAHHGRPSTWEADAGGGELQPSLGYMAELCLKIKGKHVL